jgi:hypothetical protein
MAGSGWRADIEYDRMRAEAYEKPIQERTVWQQTMLDSFEEMERIEQDQRHPVAFRIFQLLIFFILLVPIVFVVVTVLTS